MTDVAFGTPPHRSPEQVFGFSTEKLLGISDAVQNMGPVSQRISQDGRILGGLIGLFPLLEKLRGAERINSDDIHAHREDIENVVHPLVDELMPSSVLLRPFGAFGKISLDLIVQKEFQHIVPFAMKKARDYIPRAEPYVAVMASFSNLRQQFTDEINAINRMVIADIDSGSEEPNPLIAGSSLDRIVMKSLLLEPESMSDELPAFSRLITIRNSRATAKEVKLPELAAMAPGIMSMLGSLAPEDEQRPDILDALKNAASAQHVHSIGVEELAEFEQAAASILPTARDLIPESGAEIQEKFEQVKAFLT